MQLVWSELVSSDLKGGGVAFWGFGRRDLPSPVSAAYQTASCRHLGIKHMCLESECPEPNGVLGPFWSLYTDGIYLVLLMLAESMSLSQQPLVNA